jgi:uncharacterized protein YgiM (DUF1202 family)
LTAGLKAFLRRRRFDVSGAEPFMIFRTIFLIGVFLSPSCPALAQQNIFPFVGEIKEQKVNIRAGQSENFESLFRLSQGDKVIAIDQSFGWVKVHLPAQADAYISADFVKTLSAARGVVTGKRVNVRSRPALDRFPLGQLKKGDEVVIRETLDGWHKIVPPADFHGWVREDLIVFKSRYRHEEPEPPAGPGQDAGSVTAEAVAEAPRIPVEADYSRKTFRVLGTLEPQPYFDQDEIHYKLTIDGQTVYLIKGMGGLCDQLLYYQVELEGFLSREGQGQYPYPVVEAQRLQLYI